MKTVDKIPRPVQVLIVIAILAILVWRFAPVRILYPSIIASGLVTLGASAWIYRTAGRKSNAPATGPDQSESGEQIEPQDDNNKLEDEQSNSLLAGYSKVSNRRPRAQAADVTAKYFKMAAAAREEEAEKNTWKLQSRTVEPEELDVTAEKTNVDLAATGSSPDAESVAAAPQGAEQEQPVGEPSMPIITDVSVLTEEDKSQLENAVWYRCENPFCKYTHFLDVHHIVDEKDGGTNKLENLIVLCPYCHDLAHRNEIPEKEMRDWISNREERFKFKPEWHY
jgi:hypothetical protein